MNLDLIQTSCSSINSIYIIRNFLEDEKTLYFYTKQIEKLTYKDEMQRRTNVQASMTAYNALLENPDFEYLHKKIIQTLINIWTLRTPHPFAPLKFEIFNSWAMRHNKGDFTVNHIHMCNFASAFYLSVPNPVMMKFDDFEKTVELEPNMLLFFPGYTKHSVSENFAQDYRLSMSLNINIFPEHKGSN
tara:strand:+ start:646 stop:1209 length:564 start_codon:yes stop_codon:yes gene_type:complete